MPVPLYYGYDGPISPPAPAPVDMGTQHLRPPPFHSHAKPKPAVDPDTSTPITRHLNTNHARKSSQAVDPFVTPFDDEHGVQAAPSGLWPARPHSTRSNAASSTRSNPFIAVAV